MEPIFVEIAAGEDIVSTLVNLAQSHQAAGIFVSSGIGAVSEVGLSYSASHTPASPFKGSFHMTRLCGTHININDDCIPPQFMDTYGRSSFFSILFHDNHGQNFGGIVVGKIMTAGVVFVQGFLLRKPKFRRVGEINEIVEGNEEDDDSIYDDDDNDDVDDDDDDDDDDGDGDVDAVTNAAH
ncbi:hypothetical protein P8452_30068 [Trifolium repens]|nr:hypothetical protein P8452_30068 [Trifolium repens]